MNTRTHEVLALGHDIACDFYTSGAVPLAINELGETMLASPAAAAGALYLRSDRRLYCVGK